MQSFLSVPSSGPSAVAQAQDALDAARSMTQPAFITVLHDDWFADMETGDGPLAGRTFAIKDNIDLAGVPSTAACPLRVEPAVESAVAVRRAVEAGAVPIGKTNMDQFATGLVGTRSPYGACHSVASDRHVSGGSSSGSAVAVAAGVVDFALGTDTAGSGRVPAAFNGIVGLKPSRGLVSTSGLVPASPSLDCISVFARTAALAASVCDVLISPDDADPRSREMPALPPSGVARRMRTIGVPDGLLDLDAAARPAWTAALEHAAGIARLVPVDVSHFLAAARMMYDGPFLAERLATFGEILATADPQLDPTVRSIVLGARHISAADVFAGLHRLAGLRATARRTFTAVDALLLPVTPGHPTLAEVAADPIGVNSRLGTYTNMVNLLDLCAAAVPAGPRPDGLPFGVQLLAPAFADHGLFGLAARWCGEPDPQPSIGSRTLLAVAGAHLSGQPRNVDLLELGGRLHSRVSTAPGYRMYLVPGPFARPGLLLGPGGAALDMELWDLPPGAVEQLRQTIAAPLTLGPVRLDDDRRVLGFVVDPGVIPADWPDITVYGSWRAYLARTS